MAFFTLSSFIRPVLNRFAISSLFVEPEQYHAIDKDLCRSFLGNEDTLMGVFFSIWRASGLFYFRPTQQTEPVADANIWPGL